MLHSHCLSLTLTGDFSTAFLIALYSPVHVPSPGAVPRIQATSFTVELTSFLFTPNQNTFHVKAIRTSEFQWPWHKKSDSMLML